jgi:hypothetical protein
MFPHGAIFVEVSSIVVVKKNAAYATLFLSMSDVEVV